MSNVIFRNPSTFSYPFFPLFKKHLFLGFGNRKRVFKYGWPLFRITWENTHIDERDSRGSVSFQKVFKGNITIKNYPALHCQVCHLLSWHLVTNNQLVSRVFSVFQWWRPCIAPTHCFGATVAPRFVAEFVYEYGEFKVWWHEEQNLMKIQKVSFSCPC